MYFGGGAGPAGGSAQTIVTTPSSTVVWAANDPGSVTSAAKAPRWRRRRLIDLLVRGGRILRATHLPQKKSHEVGPGEFRRTALIENGPGSRFAQDLSGGAQLQCCQRITGR